MGTNRRRFVAATVAALLAGCYERGEPEPEDTVTPADVPQSADDVLNEVASVPVPSVAPGTVVSDAHRRAVVDQARERLDTAEAELAAADDLGLADIEGLRHSAAPFETVREQIRGYREDPGTRRFRRLRNAVRDLGAIIGHVRAASGDLDGGDLRDVLDSAREAYVALDRDTGYRLEAPVIDLLPTLAAAEAALDRASDRRRSAERSIPDGTTSGGAVDPERAARITGDLEMVRLETTNAGGYFDTALDAAAPSRDAAISDAISDHLGALQSTEIPSRPDGGPLPSQVRTVLSTTRARRSDVLAAADPTDPASANRVELLLEAATLRGQLEAFETAGEETFGRLEDGSFPAERLPGAKRRAVDRVAALANGAPLQRHLGALADDMVTFADRIQAGMGSAPVASAHFMYVSGRAFADRSLSRGDRLADRLAANDSATANNS